MLIGYSCSDMTTFTSSPIVRHICFVCVIALLSATGIAQQTAPPQADSSYIDEQGSAHITRVVPVPKTISPEAQVMLARRVSDAARPETLEQRRVGTDKWQIGAEEKSRAIYPVKIESQTIAGVPVRVVDPMDATPMHPDWLLINLHGGGFNSDSGSFTESIPIANLTHTRVIAVLYRLAPEHPFPAAVDDVVAVYREMLKTYKPANIGIYGTSAGAILTGEVAVKFKQLGLPLPAALGIFSGMGDFSLLGDSFAMYALNGLSGHLDIPGPPRDAEYVGSSNPKEPGAFADVCRSPWLSADAVHYQWTRPVAERDDDARSRVSARGRGRAAGGV